MSKYYYDAFMILLALGLSLKVIYWDVEEFYLDFSMIPLLGFYFIGQYSQRIFSRSDQ